MKFTSSAKYVLALVVLALVVVSAFYLAGTPGPKKPRAPVKEVLLGQSEVVIDGFRYARNDKEGAQNWLLTAKKAQMKKDTGLAKLEDLEASWSGKDGVSFTMRADQGYFDSGTKGIKVERLDKDVLIRSSNGYTLSARDLSWDSEKKELSTAGSVVVSGKDIKIEGKGLVASSGLQEVRITNGVRTEFTQTK